MVKAKGINGLTFSGHMAAGYTELNHIKHIEVWPTDRRVWDVAECCETGVGYVAAVADTRKAADEYALRLARHLDVPAHIGNRATHYATA